MWCRTAVSVEDLLSMVFVTRVPCVHTRLPLRDMLLTFSFPYPDYKGCRSSVDQKYTTTQIQNRFSPFLSLLIKSEAISSLPNQIQNHHFTVTLDNPIPYNQTRHSNPCTPSKEIQSTILTEILVA